MTGEALFAGFCWIWLVSGSLLLAARIVSGLQNLERLKLLKLQEKQFLDESVETTKTMEQEAEAIGEQCAEGRELVKVWERRLSDLARKPSLTLRLAGRESPQPSDRLWVATYSSGPRPIYGAAWADDEAGARSKLLAGLAAEFGPPATVLPLAAFKATLFA